MEVHPSSRDPSMSTTITTKPIPDVPQEITDAIVDLISHDCRSLKSLSLISRRWRPRSQYHLHRALTLTRASSPLLQAIYDDLLLAGYVRSVTIETIWWPFWNTMIPLLRKLDAVRSLALSSVGGIEPEMRQFMAGQYASLDALSLSFVTFDDFSAFSNLINSFPHLSQLSLKNVYWKRGEGDVNGASVHSFRKLSIAYCTQQTVLVKWLMAAGEKLRLESLTLTWYEKPDAVKEFMQFLGESLQNLTFSYVYSDALSGDWRENPLDLSDNTGLRSLEFKPSVMLPYAWGQLSTIPEMISTALSPRLTTISVHLAHLEEEPVPSRCLSSMDAILDQSHLRSLKTVNMVTEISNVTKPGNGWDQCVERICSSIQSAMPKMSEKGMLCILLPDA